MGAPLMRLPVLTKNMGFAAYMHFVRSKRFAVSTHKDALTQVVVPGGFLAATWSRNINTQHGMCHHSRLGEKCLPG